ncbi:hypothetical protein AB0L59_13795 [Streptomyces sp. NPDC052109]|uniref:SCO2400 family protein n=1 Tax=Streptomyces sp. NPDC052109 TaxID=3155527 RepID=UPI0034387642
MDYCSSCRRHLNGALVCPGCGAYAPDIAPPRSTVGVTAAPTAADGWFGTEAPTAVPPADFEDMPSADVEDAPPAPRGRAARRRQRARWKKSQRRAVVATAVALVGGGLTLASLDRGGSGDRAQAVGAPDNRSMGLTDEPSAAPSGPASTPTPPTATHRHAPATSTARTPAVDVPRQQTLAATPRTAQSGGRPHTAAVAPRPAASATPAAPQPRTTAPSSSGTGTSTNTGTSGTTGTAGTTTQPASSSGDGTGGSTSASTPSPSSTSSSGRLCLVVLCLG